LSSIESSGFSLRTSIGRRKPRASSRRPFIFSDKESAMFIDRNLEKSVEKAQFQAALQQAVEAARQHYAERPPPAVMTTISFLESVLKDRDCAPDPNATDEERRERQVAV